MKYTIIGNISIMQNGKNIQGGSEIELSDVDAVRLAKYIKPVDAEAVDAEPVDAEKSIKKNKKEIIKEETK